MIKYIETWFEEGNNYERENYIKPDIHSFDEYLEEMRFIITDNEDCAKRAPKVDLGAEINLGPSVVFADNGLEDAIERLSKRRDFQLYYLEVQQDDESVLDCVKRAMGKFSSLSQNYNIRCIVVWWTIDRILRKQIFPSKYSLSAFAERLALELSLERFEKKELSHFLACEELGLNSKKATLWKFDMPAKTMHGSYFPLLVANKPFYAQNHMAPVASQIIHIYEPGPNAENLRTMLERCRYAGYGTSVIGPPDRIAWTDDRNPNWNYTGVPLHCGTDWNEPSALGSIVRLFSSGLPQLLIFDIRADYINNSKLRKLVDFLLTQEITIYICCYSRGTLPWQADRIMKIRVSSNLQAGLLFRATLTDGQGGSSLPSKKICYTLAPLPSVRYSQYSGMVEEIRALTTHGYREQDIAVLLLISITALRQIKRQFHIRVNAPPRKKRRQGLDRKIQEREKAGKTPKEIAADLEVSCYYVKKRLEVLREKGNKNPQANSATPPTVQPQHHEAAGKKDEMVF